MIDFTPKNTSPSEETLNFLKLLARKLTSGEILPEAACSLRSTRIRLA